MRPSVTDKKFWMLGAILFAAIGFASAQTTTNGDGTSVQTSVPTVTASATTYMIVVGGPCDTNAAVPPQTSEAASYRSIEALSELSTMTNDMNAVFVFVPGTNGISDDGELRTINQARQTLETRYEIKMGVFVLKPGSRDYGEIAGQMAVPGVVAVVKTGVKARISGELTEAKIIDGFLTAVASGGCCPLGEPAETK